MNRIEKVSIAGLGAIGSAYMSQMLKYIPGENIRVIAGGERAVKYKTEGVLINNSHYDLNVVEPFEKTEPADLLIFAVKFNQLAEAVSQALNHVGKDTIIISMLNGITSEEIIGQTYGMEKILYSISVGIDAVREGSSTTFKNLGTISFGEKVNPSGSYSAQVLKLKDFWEYTHINYSIPEDMIRVLWWKLMVNVGVNQTSAVLRAPYGVFQNVKEARDLMIAAMHELLNISGAAGVNLTQADIKDWIITLNQLSPAGKTSMLQDIEAGRETEVNIFAGTVIELGKKYGIPTPVNQMLYQIIKASEGMFRYNQIGRK